MEVKLIVASGKLTGKSIPIKPGKFLIGRGEECQLRPQSSMVSRRHCLITVDESSATIEDLGSTNGTYLNDVKLEGRRELHGGDRVRVGMLGFEVQMSVALGGKSKPQVHSVQEAAARTAAGVSSGKEDVDVSNWLIEDSKIVAVPPDAGKRVSEDTMSGKSLVDTTTIASPPPPHQPAKEKKPDPAEKHGHSKIIGKMHRPAKPTAADSGSAAADALRQFFHRKKP